MSDEMIVKLSEYEALKNKYNKLVQTQDDIVRLIAYNDSVVMSKMEYDHLMERFQAYEILKLKYNALVDKCNSIIESFEDETGCFNGECGIKECKI